jgi:hypothetical protein
MIHVFEIKSYRVCPWIPIVDVTGAMGSKVSVAILTLWDLEFAFVQPNAILDKEQRLIWEERWTLKVEVRMLA